MAQSWMLADAAHLLRRAGFGGSYEQVKQLHALGFDGAIDWLVDYQYVNDPSTSAVAGLGLDTSTALGVIQSQLYRMAASTRPLQEKLTWFWHGHFVSALGKVPAPLMVIQLDTWRRQATGKFRTFLTAMHTDPGMLIYLDNNTNVVGQPNENFARELMELFTLGVGNYSETDVQEAARALTGWTVLPSSRTEAVFVPRRHDAGVKTVLGVTGHLTSDDLMDILYAQPACASFVCGRLYKFFVGTNPGAADLATLVADWKRSDGNIASLLKVLFRLESFWAPASRKSQIKSPVEFGIGLFQRLKVPLTKETLQALSGALRDMGQTPLVPPDVSGYPENLEWAGASNLLARYNAAFKLVYGVQFTPWLDDIYTGIDTSSSLGLLEGLLERMGPLELGQGSYSALLMYLHNGGYSGRNATQILNKVRGVLRLIAATPEYQLN